MLESLRLYWHYVSFSIHSQLQYRASFVMLALGSLILTGVDFVGLWALFHRFGSLQGWHLPEVAVLYGMVNIAFGLAEAVARGFDAFEVMVRDGGFDRILLRPRGAAFQVLSQELQLLRIGRIAQGAAAMAWGWSSLAVSPSLPGVLVLAAGIVSGACIFTGLFVLQATLSFWTVSTLELVNTVTYGGVETAQYPLSIYRPWFRRIFTFVIPLACINYWPLQAALGRSDPLGAPTWFLWLSPVLGAVFLLVSLRVFAFGVRHYRSTGS